jgi:starch-binding outer membrane protein, SusD/RagB family
VTKPMMFAEIVRLLDEAAMDLQGGGDAFPFKLSSGYMGFDKPMTFRTFNRAIRARVAVYMKDYPAAIAALGMSFMDDTPTTLADLDKGVYHAYSTNAGDQVNNLINPNIYAHPTLQSGAQASDARVMRKIEMAMKAGSAQGLTSNIQFTIYSDPGSPVAIIRNEELVLLLAEARFFTNDVQGAYAALNAVRTLSGGLQMVPQNPDMMMFVDALLYERRYSLMFEGHRWIDLRRFMRPLPLDMPDHTQNVRYPIPLAECNARPGEPACELGST